MNGANFDNEIISALGAGKFLIEVIDQNGCKAVDHFELEYLEEYELEIILESTTVSLGDTIAYNAFTNMQNIESWEWNPSELVEVLFDNPLSGRLFPYEDSWLSLTLTNHLGCAITAVIFLEVPESDLTVFIPNAFSPNGDGINDYFTVFSGNDVAEIDELTIFNRWGSVVWRNNHFQPNFQESGWDGIFNGQKAQAGIYTYIARIRFKDGRTNTTVGEFVLVE